MRIKTVAPIAAEELADLTPVDRLGRRFAGIWGHLPSVAAAWKAFNQVLETESTLPPRLVELVRLRIAFHNQCRSCMALRYSNALEDGLTEELVCSLERPEEAEDLTPAERAALRYADLFATNHLAIDDRVLDDLRRYFDERAVVELGIQCARMVGFGRLAAVFGVYEDLPDRERQGGASDAPFTPWGADVLIRPSAR